jgi:Lrp/AsnC family transcriptional regulator for asnA, asnC and gidA
VKICQIDEVNANILKALLKDARTSFTEMAKQNDISVAAVRNRYLNLKKGGVINGSMMQINLNLIGLNCHGVLNIKVEQKNISAVKNYLKTTPYILSTWKDGQGRTITASFATPNLTSFRNLISDLKRCSLIKQLIIELHEGLTITDYPENLVIKTDKKIELQNFKEKPYDITTQEKTSEPVKNHLIQTPQLMQMETIDLQIANSLSQNARTPFSSIAKKFNKSTAYIIERYKKLKERGFFIKSSITVDLEKLGYPANALVFIKTRGGTEDTEIRKHILEIPNVIVLARLIGEYDKLAVIPLESFKDLFETQKQFGTIEGIEDFQIKIISQFSKWPINFAIPLENMVLNSNV